MVKTHCFKLSMSLFPRRSKEIDFEEDNQEMAIYNSIVVGLIRKTMHYKVISTQGLPSQEYRRDKNVSVSR